MILNKTEVSTITSLKDLEENFNGKAWLDKNAHHYDEIQDEPLLISTILTAFFTDYKGAVSVFEIRTGIWMVHEFSIPLAVVANHTIIPCNSIEAAENTFMGLAHKWLKKFRGYREYPKKKMSYPVLKTMVETYDVKLSIVGRVSAD